MTGSVIEMRPRPCAIAGVGHRSLSAHRVTGDKMEMVEGGKRLAIVHRALTVAFMIRWQHEAELVPMPSKPDGPDTGCQPTIPHTRSEK